MRPVRKLRIAFIGLILSTLCGYTLLRKADAESPERDHNPGITHRDDPCSHLPDPPGEAHGIDKQCPPAGTSSGVVKGDFNGDGFADLAIGEPGATSPVQPEPAT